MRVFITISVVPPRGTPSLDALQRQGAASLLDDVISRAVNAVGPDGAVITVIDSRVAAHPDGAIVAVATDGPDGPAAGEAVAALVEHVLDSTPSLTGWRITDSTVEELPPAARGASRPPLTSCPIGRGHRFVA